MASTARPSPPAPPSPRLRAADVRATLAALAGQPLEDLLCFRRLKKWTVPCFADHWNTSEDTARRALRDLCAAGVIGCLQGAVHGRGGREPDLYFLTRLGARVLTRHLGLGPNEEIRAPTVALDAGEVTKGGLTKHKVAAKPGQDAHDLACLELAVHLGWLPADSGWRTREALHYAAGHDRHAALLVPDFYRRTKDRLWCVEVEGTTEAKHIRAKHRRYRALFADWARDAGYDFRGHLTLVLTGEATREPVRRLHERAYVTQDYAYWLSWTTLDAVLDGDWEQGLLPHCSDVGFYEVRDWWREHLDRQLRALGR